jgi:hypothetical protein
MFPRWRFDPDQWWRGRSLCDRRHLGLLLFAAVGEDSFAEP